MPHTFFAARRLLLAASLASSTIFPLTALAAYPDKPIRMVVPYPPGGATDVIGRIIAARLSTTIGQQVIVENKGGAGGNLGADAVAKAKPDGYTILMGAITSHATMATLEKGRLPYDLLKDLKPAMVIGYVPLVFVVNPSVPVKDFGQLVSYAKANPGKLSYASSGVGAPQRMAAELFKKQANVDILHVPYKGSGPAMTDLIAGQVMMMAETVPAAQQFIKDGKLRALAVTTPQRISMLPDVPTVQESGWKDFEVVSNFGVLVPAATPAEVVTRLNSELAKIVQNPDVKAQMLQQGVYAAAPQSSVQATARLNQEVVRWGKVITDASIKSDN
jgi:tripartite-type tricarboxylate transporter receptor subunit TctC